MNNTCVSLRHMTIDDIPFFIDIRNECCEFLHDNTQYAVEESRAWFQKNSPLFFVISYRNNDVGYFRTSEHSKENRSIFIGADIHKDYRNKGIASAAYPVFIEYLREIMNINILFLDVLETNFRAIHLYNKLGFHEISKTKISRNTGEEIGYIRMQLNIKDKDHDLTI